jgi:outer membrane protein OmpA-like peptidoglycan-associated protein
LAALLVILSIFGIGYYGLLLNLTNCTNAPSWPLLLPGISLLIAAWITNCFLRTILTALWIVSLLVWCGTHQIGVCNPTNNTIDNNIINPIVNSLNNVIESTTNITPDSDSAVISQISSDDTHLVTIDQAINNPDLLNDCRNNLYLPSATIFGFDQDIIDPSMDANLEKLNQILQKTHPQKIIITGYSDNSGDETPEGFNHNIELSQNRANAVANWLIEKGNITADRIDARGAGSKFPLTNILGQQSLNRRVEIKMQYPSCKLN